MIDLVIRDYKMGWKQGLKNMTKSNPWFVYLYFFIFPIITFDPGDSVKGIFIYYGILLPIVLGIFLSRMFPCRITKTMFLCPMDKKEREQYIFSAYWLRVSLSVFLFTGIGVLLIATHLLNIWQFLLLLVGEFLISLTTNLYLDVAFLKLKFEKKHNLKGYTTWYILNQLLSLIFTFIYFNIVTNVEPSIRTWHINLSVFLLAAQVAMTAKMILGYWKKVMVVALDYELCFSIVDKSEGV